MLGDLDTLDSEKFAEIQKKRGQIELGRSLSREEEDALEMMREDEVGMTEKDKREMELEKNWDPEKGEKMMEAGIFKEDSLLEKSVLERSIVEAYRISRKTGLEFSEAKQMIKEFVFGMKKLEEENLKLENQRLRREKKKKFRRMVNKMEQEPFDPFTEWDEEGPAEAEKNLEDIYRESPQWTDLNAGVVKVLNEYVKQATRRERGELDGEELYRVQKESNLMRFLDDFFFYRQTKLAHCTFDNHIYIDETIQHPQSRTTFLFWSFWEKDLETLSGKDGTRRRQQAELAEQVSANLNRFASYLGRIALTQLGGKKPPKFVFLKSEREVFLENARKKFAKEFPVLIRKQILQQKEEFAPMFRSREDIQEYIDMNLPLYLDECLKHHGKLFSNHTVLGQLKNKHGSLEVYLQKLAGKKVAPRKVRLSPSEKAERKFQKNLRDFNAKWDGQL